MVNTIDNYLKLLTTRKMLSFEERMLFYLLYRIFFKIKEEVSQLQEAISQLKRSIIDEQLRGKERILSVQAAKEMYQSQLRYDIKEILQ